MCNLFDSTKTEDTQSNQTGKSRTEGNLWPQLGDFFTQYLNNARSANVPINGYQTGAADQQTDVSGKLQPAQSVANTVATNGITPQSIQSFMSPYIANVINPTLQAQDIQNKQAVSTLRGNQATRGALGNNTGSEAAFFAGVQPAQEMAIGSLLNQGYGQATNTAAQNAQTQLAGANTAGSLVNANTGANVALGNLGQNIWGSNYQNTLLPNQFVSGLTGLSGIAGSNTNSSGTATGSGTATSTPSMWDQGRNILSGAGALFGMFAKGGAVGKADGGEVGMTPFDHSEDMVSKVGKAFGALHKMRKHAESGGAIEDKDTDKQEFEEALKRAAKVWPPTIIPPMTPRHFDIGGDVGMGSWDATVTPAGFGDTLHDFGGKMGKLSDAMGGSSKPSDPGGGGDHASMLAGSQQALAAFLNGVSSANRQGYDDGGTVGSWGERALGPLSDAWDNLRSVGETAMSAYPAIYDRIKAAPEAVTQGLGHAALNMLPLGPASQFLGDVAMMPRPRDSAVPVEAPHAAAAAPVGDDGPSEMTPFEAFHQSAPDPDQPIADSENSSIASAHEALPWKAGVSDARPPHAASRPVAEPSMWDKLTGSTPTSTGVWNGETMTPWQRRMMALSQVGDFKGVGNYAMDLDKQRLAQGEGQRAQELQPSRVKLLAAQAKNAAQEADLNYQIKAADAMGDVKRSQELKRLKMMMGFAKETDTPAGVVSGMSRQPPGPPPVEGAEWYPDYGGWHVPDPNRPGKYLKYNPD